MAYNTWKQPGPYNQPYNVNPSGGLPGQYQQPPSHGHQAPPYQNTTYPQWGQPPVSQGYAAPSAPYQYAVPPPAPPPQSQQVPSYMNYNPNVYGALAGNTTPLAQQPPTLPPRNPQDGQHQPSWQQGPNLAPAPFKPSVTGSVRYKFRPDPSGWQQSSVPAPVPERPSSSGYNSGPWPEYQESPQSSPMQPHATTASNPVSPPYSPDAGRTPTLPPRPIPSPLEADFRYPPPPPSGRSTPSGQANAHPPSQGGGWFNPSGSIFPQAPASVAAQTPPPMPPRPAAPPHRSSEPVSPMEHRDSVNSLYEPPPARSGQVSRLDSGSSRDSFHVSIPGELQKDSDTPAPQNAGQPSAFSLGASSDWELFDSGNGEDVDDTALYARKAEPESKPAEVHMPELDSTEVKPTKSLEPNEGRDQTPTPVPPAVRVEGEEPVGPAPGKEQDLPGVRSESPEPLDEAAAKDGKTERVGNDMTASLDSHLRKLTMEESHFSSMTAKAAAPATTSSASTVDIAPGLDVWYKSSLLRCIAMLYREAGANEVEEKHKIFLDFVTEEARLRGIELPGKSASLQPPQQWSEVFSPSDVVVQGPDLIKGDASDTNKTTKTTVIIPPTSPEDDTEYSPGGRPVIPRPTSSGQDNKAKGHRPTVSVTSVYSQDGAGQPQQSPETPEKAPTSVLGGADFADKPPQPPPLSTKPTYKPFRDRNNSGASLHTPGPVSPGPQTPLTAVNVANSPMQAAYKPYVPFAAAMQPMDAVLQQSPAPASENLANKTDVVAPPASSLQPTKEVESPQHPTPLQPAGLSIKKSEPNLTAARPAVTPLISVQPPSTLAHRRQPSVASPAVQELDSLVFQTNQEPPLNPRLENLKTSLLLYPSDYTFVNTAFDKWKTMAAGNRARAEAEARTRYNDSQTHIDALYNENQIAYQDIALLEDSFKKQEAEVRRQENEAEYESYLADVFDPLYKRLQEEIGAVTELLLEAQHMTKEDGVTGKALNNLQGSDKVDLAESLGLVIDLHHKLEERHAELVECIVKRDRRRQAIDEAAAEGADKLTQIEFRRRLDSIERQAAVTRAEDKKARVQPLWQLCRASAMRGTRENKALASEILAAIEAAGDDLVGADQTLLKVRAQHTFEELAKRSQALEACFYGIDTELNLVEYEAAVAHATLDKAPRQVSAKLTEEKNAEDMRLKGEHEDRLRAVQATLQAGLDAVEKVSRGLLGNTERALMAQKELERAKRRTGDFRNALSVLSPV